MIGHNDILRSHWCRQIQPCSLYPRPVGHIRMQALQQGGNRLHSRSNYHNTRQCQFLSLGILQMNDLQLCISRKYEFTGDVAKTFI